MTTSERVYQALLVAYPSDHRRVYGDPMIQLFRDRMRRDGGGFRTLIVWVRMGSDLAASAFKERMETIMAIENWTNRWWEASVVLLAVNSVVFGFLGASSGNLKWGVMAGFVPGALLFAGLAFKRKNRLVATVTLILGSIGAASAWWVMYTVVFALIVVVGGFWSGKIGPERAQPEVAI